MADEKRRMGPSEYLLLRGWERYVDEEVAAEYRRKREADEGLWFIADNGIRFRYPRLGISGMTMKEALALALTGEARDLGSLERLVEVLDAAREGQRRGGNGTGFSP